MLFAVGGIVLLRTPYGQSLFAIGGNENAAALMGRRGDTATVGQRLKMLADRHRDLTGGVPEDDG